MNEQNSGAMTAASTTRSSPRRREVGGTNPPPPSDELSVSGVEAAVVADRRGRRQRATPIASTTYIAPSVVPDSVPGLAKRGRGRQAKHHPVDHAEAPAADHSGAIDEASAIKAVPRRRRGSQPAAESSQASHRANTIPSAPGLPVGADTPSSADDIERICQRLFEIQKKRMFCIQAQQRMDRSMQAAIARAIGYNPDSTEAERKAVFKRAGAIIKAVEHDMPYDRLPIADVRSEALANFLPFIPINARSRAVWDGAREAAEEEMRKLARTLPVFPWVRDNAKGVGDLGLARLVGEAPLIGSYATPEKLWKRLGLAVIAGERQQKKSNATDAMLHGYRPQRRAEAWSVLSDSMIRSQWRGPGGDPDDPDATGYPIGPYGAVYARRKAMTLPRIAETEDLLWDDRKKWTPKRRDRDARRVAGKEFLRDLWRVWHGLPARQPERFANAA